MLPDPTEKYGRGDEGALRWGNRQTSREMLAGWIQRGLRVFSTRWPGAGVLEPAPGGRIRWRLAAKKAHRQGSARYEQFVQGLEHVPVGHHELSPLFRRQQRRASQQLL